MKLLQRTYWSFSKRFYVTKQLVYEKHGDPLKVLHLRKVDLGESLASKKVCVRWLATPVNPADINQIQGVYPIKPPLPAVGGSEGVGVVEAVSDGTNEFRQGDRVIPGRSGIGVWQTCGFYSSDDLVKVDDDLPLDVAATFQVNPPTAYRMLTDFVDLKPGDAVIQNGANSTVGRAAIQIAHVRGLRTVNIIRKTDHSEQLVEELKSLGADEVLTEEELAKSRGKVSDARLALNCVGGRSALLLASCLGKNGILVTYGGMSKQPLQIPTGPLIFKKIELKGFWMSEWYSRAENKQKRDEMFRDIANLVREGKFRPPNLEKHKLDDWKNAFGNAMAGSARKQLLIM